MKSGKHNRFSFLLPYPGSRTLLSLSFMIVAAMAGGFLLVQQDMRQHAQEDVAATLQAVLKTTNQSVSNWLDDHSRGASVWASNRLLRSMAVQLTGQNLPPPALAKSPAQSRLRNLLKPVLTLNRYPGFLLTDLKGHIRGASHDHELGLTNSVLREPGMMKKIISGKTVITLPRQSERPLIDAKGKLRESLPTMLVATAVKSNEGKTVAVLVFRIDASQGFSATLAVGRIGQSGETYAFNSEGIMISQSRFDEEMQDMGLLGAGASAILTLALRDPGVNLVMDNGQGLASHNPPLTKMAASALQGASGSDLEGYRDYRGVPVTGAWLWNSQYGFGIATELDVAEAYLGLDENLSVLNIATGIGILMVVILVWLQTTSRYKLEQSEQFNRAINENTAEGIITIDERGIVQSFNSAAERIFGYTRQEVIGQNVNMLMDEPDQDPHDNYIKRFFESSRRETIGPGLEVHGKRRDNSLFHAELSISKLEVHNKVLFTGLVRDISERKRFEASLEQARDKAEAASQAKSQFLTTMSHEIRTPMNGVLGMLYMLGKTMLDEKQNRFVKTAVSSSELLLKVIDDVLDFSRLEANKMELENSACDPGELAEETTEMLAREAHEKELEIFCHVGQSVPSRVYGDPVRIRQILANLLNNAIKFTEKGHVAVYVDRKDGQIQYRVVDTGIGLTPEQQEGIFEAFRQADNSHTRKYGGTGLGLAISSRLVGSMGGKLTLISEAGRGSEFCFALPLHTDTDTVDNPEHNLLLSQQRILLVDDNDTSLQVLRSILETWQIEHIGFARSGADALKQLDAAAASNQPQWDMVITDLDMPEMNGLALTKAIRNTPRISDIIVVMLSSRSSLQSQPGPDAWLDKPIRQKELHQRLLRLASKEKSSRQGSDTESESENETQNDKVQHHASGWWFGGSPILLVDDNSTNQDVGNEILTHAGFTVDLACDGKEAVQAAKRKHYDAVLMDIQMPVMDGLDATRTLRALGGRFAELPIIAMTAHALSSHSENSMAAGMNAHITKPIDPDVLFITLARWIAPCEKSKQAEDIVATDAPKKVFPYLAGIDTEEGLHRLRDSHEAYERVLLGFRAKQIGVADAIEAKLDKGDFEAVRLLAHALKGSSGNISATELFQYSAELEHECSEDLPDIHKVQAGLDKLRPALVTVIKSIAELAEKHDRDAREKQSEDSVHHNIDIDVLYVMLEKIELLMCSDLGEAQGCLEKLGREVKLTELASSFESLKNAFENFDVEAARHSILQMKVKIQARESRRLLQVNEEEDVSRKDGA